MKVAFLFSALAIASADAQVFTQAWIQRYNSFANGDDTAVAVAVDTNGNAYITGYSTGTNGYVTIKYSSQGLSVWTNRYEGPAHTDLPVAIALGKESSVFVTGVSYGDSSGPDYATVAYSSDGIPLWTNRYSSVANNEDKGQGIAVDCSNNVYVTGCSRVFGVGEYVTIKYSNAGVPQWTNIFNGVGGARATIAVDADCSVVVAVDSVGTNGYSDFATIKYSVAGLPVWTNYYGGPGDYADIPVGVAADRVGNVYVTGVSYGSGTGFDFATIGYSAVGTPLWTNRYNGLGNDWDYAKAIAVNDSGEVIVAGDSPRLLGGPPLITTLAYSGAGVALWTNLYTGGNGDDEVAAIAIDKSGNIFVTGYSVGLGTGSDYAMIKYSSAGVALCTNRYDGPASSADYPMAIAVAQNGDVFVTGTSPEISSGWDFATIKYSVLSPIPLNIQNVGNQVVLSWTNVVFSLQSAPEAGGVFTNILGATSPHTNLITGSRQFFRLVSN